MGYTAQQLVKRYQTVKAGRQSWDSYWQELAYYCLPRKAYITEVKAVGDRLPTDLYDSTAVNANQVLAAGLHGYLTNPQSKWFSLRMQNEKTDEISGVKEWLHEAEARIYDVLNSSNFNQEIHEVYLDLGSIGTSVMYEEEDPTDIVRFYTLPIGKLAISEDDAGRVNTVFIEFEYTAEQAYRKWGKKAGTKVLECIEKKLYDQPFNFLQCVYPRSDRDVAKKDAKNMEYASTWISSESKIIQEGGYREFPFFVPRFSKVSGDMYGYSPAMNVLPDIKMLNAMAKTMIKAAQKIVDPPLQVPNEAFLLPLRTMPGGINIRNAGYPGEEIRPLLTGGNIPIGLEMEQERRQIIQRAFFVDLFILLAERKNMTATEVQERVAEKMLLLGPALGRLMSELLDPIVTRTFNILLRNGSIPPPPPGLENQDYVVEYVSPLARAQRAGEIQSINQVLVLISQMAEVNPEALDKIDMDQTIDEIADIHGTNPELIRDDDEVEELRAKRAQAKAAMAQIQAAQSIAQTAKTGAEAGKASKEASNVG